MPCVGVVGAAPGRAHSDGGRAELHLGRAVLRPPQHGGRVGAAHQVRPGAGRRHLRVPDPHPAAPVLPHHPQHHRCWLVTSVTSV